jgi:methyltransferase
MKKGSNGEFWKRKKQRPNDDGGKRPTNKVNASSSKRSSGESSIESEHLRASEVAWASKLLPSTLHKGAPANSTVSVAIPSSILKTVKSTELKTYLVGQIARACAIHEVDEIIVYMDTPYESTDELEKGPGLFLCRLLQYLECPHYMRGALFPPHNDLKFASLLPLLNMPHHMNSDCASLYREGVVIEKPVADGSLVNVGLAVEVFIEHQLQAGVRVTVKLPEASLTPSSSTKSPLICDAVSPLSIRKEHGLYWGYQTRLVSSFSEVFSGCPYCDSDDNSDENSVGGYDLLIGNSEKGSRALDTNSLNLKPFKHGLIVFGGVGGIEACVESDKSITTTASNAECLFDHWLDLAHSEGSRGVRTEEVILIGLTKLNAIFKQNR